jgi:hypothetical protein
MWYMDDSAPAYFSWVVRYVLKNKDHGQWIAKGGPTVPSPCSPDLSPLQLLLTIKRHFTITLWMPVRLSMTIPRTSEQMQQSTKRHVKACIESHGGHFEHLLLMYSFSHNSQMKCFQIHDMEVSPCFGMWNLCLKFLYTFLLHSV